jgi:hypothetical protein
MDGDRKYRQHGYQDSGRESNHFRSDTNRSERPRQGGPKLPIDITGPKLPRLVQSVAAARCFNCAATLPADIDFRNGICPKCNAVLHCCKQCVHFDSSTRFQCLKPIPVRIAIKDQVNTCELFRPRVTVARDAMPSTTSAKVGTTSSVLTTVPAPRNANDARAAFDSLFKK